MTTGNRKIMGIAVGALVLSAAGCGLAGQSGTGAAESVTLNSARVSQAGWPTETPRSGLAEGLRLPLEEYLPSYAEEIGLQAARDNAEIGCMVRMGFENWATEELGTSPPEANNAANMARRYGITDLEQARSHGYRPPPAAARSVVPSVRNDPAAQDVLSGLTDDGRALRSFEGEAVPEGGCLGEVNQLLGHYDYAAEELLGESFTRSQETPRVRAAMAEWSECMGESGYEVSSVWDTEEHYDVLAPAADESEIALAVADVECKQRTGLVAIWFAEEQALQEQLIADHQDALNAIAAHNESLRAEVMTTAG